MTVNFLAYFCPIFFFLWQDLKFQTHFPLPSRKLLSSSSSASQLVYAHKGKLIECSPKWSIIRKKNAGQKKGIGAFWKLSNYDCGIIYALCSLAVGMILGLGLVRTVELRRDGDILTRAGFLLHVPWSPAAHGKRMASDKDAQGVIFSYLPPLPYPSSNSWLSRTAWTSTMKEISLRLRNQPQRRKRSLLVMENEPWMES